MSKHTTDKGWKSCEWEPGDPCPYCGKHSVKYNGGQPKCIADDCGKFMPGPARVVAEARMTGTEGTR